MLLLLLLLFFLSFLFILFFPVQLHRSLELFLVILQSPSVKIPRRLGTNKPVVNTRCPMAEMLISPFLDHVFQLILLICAAGNSPTHTSENKESTSSNGFNQHLYPQWNNHVTMLRCDSLARFRYRDDEEPKYPGYKPSAGGINHQNPYHLGLKDHCRGHNDDLEAR